jgi:hypothetical protein
VTNLSERDQKALKLLAGALLVAAVIYFWPEAGAAEETAGGANATEVLEKRLTKARELLLQVPDKQALFKQAQADLAAREKGMLPGDTAAQAQAQLFQILRRVGRAQGPPIEVRANEIGQARAFGDDYGEVTVSVSFECGVEQLVNLLADLGAQPELLATNEIRVGQASGPEKLLPVRLSISGIVPRKLIPEKKGLGF